MKCPKHGNTSLHFLTLAESRGHHAFQLRDGVMLMAPRTSGWFASVCLCCGRSLLLQPPSSPSFPGSFHLIQRCPVQECSASRANLGHTSNCRVFKQSIAAFLNRRCQVPRGTPWSQERDCRWPSLCDTHSSPLALRLHLPFSPGCTFMAPFPEFLPLSICWHGSA